MTTKNWLKYIFIAVVLILGGLAMADSLGYFNPKPYTAVSHGDHVHYVPENRDPDVGIDKFPSVPPGPHEVITPTGLVVPEDSLKMMKN